MHAAGRDVVLPPVVFGVSFLLLWQAWVDDLRRETVRHSEADVDHPALFDNPSLVTKACVVTGVNALVGLILGAILGFAACGADQPVSSRR